MKDKIHIVWQIDPSIIWERDWLDEVLGDFEIIDVIDLKHNITVNKSIVISAQKKADDKLMDAYMQRIKTDNLKVGIIHLADEHFDSNIDFYNNASFVFRNYYRSDAKKISQYFPLGYKTGISSLKEIKAIEDRTFSWSFAGQLKGTRFDMFEAAKKVPGGKFHLTSSWNCDSSLSTQEYAELLNNTIFCLCPKGNSSLETFRIFEALEMGAIPIVEEHGGLKISRECFSPSNFIKSKIWNPLLLKKNFKCFFKPSYWEQSFGSNFPLPRIYNWETLEVLIDQIDIVQKQAEVSEFWKYYKVNLRRLVSWTIYNHLFEY